MSESLYYFNDNTFVREIRNQLKLLSAEVSPPQVIAGESRCQLGDISEAQTARMTN